MDLKSRYMEKSKKKKSAGDKGAIQDRTRTVPSKTIDKGAGKVLKQYPARVGYHGTDDEKDLNPEE